MLRFVNSSATRMLKHNVEMVLVMQISDRRRVSFLTLARQSRFTFLAESITALITIAINTDSHQTQNYQENKVTRPGHHFLPCLEAFFYFFLHVGALLLRFSPYRAFLLFFLHIRGLLGLHPPSLRKLLWAPMFVSWDISCTYLK